MRYLVTGARGFAGKHLVSHLKELGHEVISWGREDCDLLDDVKTKEKIVSLNPEGIFHLAAPQTSVANSWNFPTKTLQENFRSTFSVLEAARALNPKPRVLFTSSAEVIGNAGSGPISEGVDPEPLNFYGLSKLLGEQVCQFYSRVYGVPTVIARSFNHIGPGQRADFVFPNFSQQIAKIEATGKSGEIGVGNLEAKRDFTDVRDMVEAYAILMERGISGGIYHVGSVKSFSIRWILNLLVELSTANAEIKIDPQRIRPNDIPEQRCNPSKLRSLGWEPKITLTQTLADILNEARQGLR